jgi:hypothetical protein
MKKRGPKPKKYTSADYDWRNKTTGWPFKGGVNDPEYLKARSKLFQENGNGWWWGQKEVDYDKMEEK